MQAPWNTLELAKLAISAITPLILFFLGTSINRSLKNAERATGLRSEIYKTVGGDLNDIYSYLAFVGGWKDLTPSDVISRKRSVDKAMYTYKPFFSKQLFATYERFMHEAFSTFGGAGQNARIRSDIETTDGSRRTHCHHPWQAAWEECFTKERNSDAQRQAYDQFLAQLARDLKL
jgi:hypothetical protein